MARARLLLPILLVIPLLTAAEAAPPVRSPATAAASRKFVAVLSGAKALPPTGSRASARATFAFSADGARLRYRVTAARLRGVRLVALRAGTGATAGPPVAILYGPRAGRGETGGRLAEGTLTAGDLLGPLAGGPSLAGLAEAMRAQTVYVEVDTITYAAGEIRGQVHGDHRRPTDL